MGPRSRGHAPGDGNDRRVGHRLRSAPARGRSLHFVPEPAARWAGGRHTASCGPAHLGLAEKEFSASRLAEGPAIPTLNRWWRERAAQSRSAQLGHWPQEARERAQEVASVSWRSLAADNDN